MAKADSDLPGASSRVAEDDARYKTILCRHFPTFGGCDKGDACTFAHGEWELREYHPPDARDSDGRLSQSDGDRRESVALGALEVYHPPDARDSDGQLSSSDGQWHQSDGQVVPIKLFKPPPQVRRANGSLPLRPPSAPTTLQAPGSGSRKTLQAPPQDRQRHMSSAVKGSSLALEGGNLGATTLKRPPLALEVAAQAPLASKAMAPSRPKLGSSGVSVNSELSKAELDQEYIQLMRNLRASGVSGVSGVSLQRARQLEAAVQASKDRVKKGIRPNKWKRALIREMRHKKLLPTLSEAKKAAPGAPKVVPARRPRLAIKVAAKVGRPRWKRAPKVVPAKVAAPGASTKRARLEVPKSGSSTKRARPEAAASGSSTQRGSQPEAPASGASAQMQPLALPPPRRTMPPPPGPLSLRSTATAKGGILRHRVMAPKLGDAKMSTGTSSSSRTVPAKVPVTSSGPRSSLAKAVMAPKLGDAATGTSSSSQSSPAKAKPEGRRRLLPPPPHMRRSDVKVEPGLRLRRPPPRSSAGEAQPAPSGQLVPYVEAHETWPLEGTTPKAAARSLASAAQAGAANAGWEPDSSRSGWKTGDYQEENDSYRSHYTESEAWKGTAKAEEHVAIDAGEAWREEEEVAPGAEEADEEREWEPWPEEGKAWPLLGAFDSRGPRKGAGLYAAPSSKVVYKLCADLKAATASGQFVAPLLKRLHVWLLSQWVAAVQVCIEEAGAHHALVAPLACLQDDVDRDAVWACKVIGAAGFGHDGNAWALAEAGAIDAMCSLIEGQPSDGEVQRAATYALGYLASNGCIQKRLASSGAVGRVLRSVELNAVKQEDP